MELLQECEQILVESQMRMRTVARIARILRDAGIKLSYYNIAEYGNLNEAEIEKVFRWNLTKKRNQKLDFVIDHEVEAKGDFAKLLAGLLWISTNKKRGLNIAADKSGLAPERVMQLAQQHFKDIKKEFPSFAMYWLRAPKEQPNV